MYLWNHLIKVPKCRYVTRPKWPTFLRLSGSYVSTLDREISTKNKIASIACLVLFLKQRLGFAKPISIGAENVPVLLKHGGLKGSA